MALRTMWCRGRGGGGLGGEGSKVSKSKPGICFSRVFAVSRRATGFGGGGGAFRDGLGLGSGNKHRHKPFHKSGTLNGSPHSKRKACCESEVVSCALHAVFHLCIVVVLHQADMCL